jgi:hypothetical protein
MKVGKYYNKRCILPCTLQKINNTEAVMKIHSEGMVNFASSDDDTFWVQCRVVSLK